MFTWLVETSRGRGLGSSNEEEPGRQWSNIGAGGKEHLYYRSRLQEAEDPQVSRSYLWLSRSVYFFFTESDYIYKNPIKKEKFFSKLSARGRHVFFLSEAFLLRKNIKTEWNEEDGQRPSLTSAIMMSMNSKQPFSMHPILHEPKYTPLHSSSEAIRRACLPTPSVSPEFTRDFLQLLQNFQSPLTM